MYVSNILMMIDAFLSNQLIVLVVNLSVLIIMQFVVLRSMFSKLSAEAARTGDFLRLIPVQIIESTPKLRTWFSESGSETLLEENVNNHC